MTRLIGRSATVDALAAEVPRRGLVTIAGPGGIGRTTLAVAVAERLSTM